MMKFDTAQTFIQVKSGTLWAVDHTGGLHIGSTYEGKDQAAKIRRGNEEASIDGDDVGAGREYELVIFEAQEVFQGRTVRLCRSAEGTTVAESYVGQVLFSRMLRNDQFSDVVTLGEGIATLSVDSMAEYLADAIREFVR
jgi:hypothetical protein